MANRVAGVSEKLMECAAKEFLAHGYSGASLRAISENAGTTPRSVYTRYGDKEGLFRALTDPVAVGLKTLFEDCMLRFQHKPAAEQKWLFRDGAFAEEYREYMRSILDFMYAHWDRCRLLICCSEGTTRASYLDELAAIEEKYTLLYIACTGNDALSSGRAQPLLIHLLCSSFVYGFFEIVRHDMERPEAETYLGQLQEFYACGWADLLNAR